MSSLHVVRRTLVREPAYADDLARRYQAGASISELRNEFGANFYTVAAILDARAIPRHPAGLNHPRRRRMHESAIIATYGAGTSVNALAQAYEVSRSVVDRVLRANGIKPRGQSEAERVKWASMDAEARTSQVAAAHEARRGQVDSADVQAARARTRMERGINIHTHERELGDALRALGLDPVPQFAVERYNLDLGLEESGIAVEILCGSLHAKMAAHWRERGEYLLNAGWCIIVVAHTQTRYPMKYVRVAEHVRACVERAGSNKALRGQYGMLSGQGKPIARLQYQLNGRTLVL